MLMLVTSDHPANCKSTLQDLHDKNRNSTTEQVLGIQRVFLATLDKLLDQYSIETQNDTTILEEKLRPSKK